MYELTPLMKSIQNQNKFNPGQSTNYLPLNQVGFGFEFEGLMFMNFLNSTMSKVELEGCYKGKFVYDPRSKINNNSTSSPYFLIRMLKIQNLQLNNQQKPIHHVVCLDVVLSTLHDLFQNVVKSTKQYYIIDPRTKSIIYNSKSDFEFDNMSIENFYSLELQNLESQDDAILLNKTIDNNYNLWTLGLLPYATTKDLFNYTQQYKVIPYNRNGTLHQVILNPIVIQDRIPDYISEVEKVYGTQMSLAYLQINMISNQDLQQQSQDLQRLQYYIYITVSIILLILSFISILISIYYALQIYNLVQQPISHLCSVLKKIQIQNQHRNMQDILQKYQNKATEIFLSKETSQLYQSFYQVFQILLYTSESFFSENESKTLIRLCKEIDFLQQFQNYHALGITHNNIGCLLLNQQHYFQALEHFKKSIIYARYEIEQFCLNKPNSIYCSMLKQFCYSDKILGNKQEKINLESKEFMTSFIKKNQETHIRNLQNHSSIDRNTQNEKQDQTFKKKMQRVQSSRNPSQQRSTKDCPSQFDKRLSDKNNNQDSSIFNQSIQKCSSVHKNAEENPNLFDQQFIDEHEQDRNEVVQLLSKIFFRKQNYIITLIQFQEQIDFRQSKQKSKAKKQMEQSNLNYNLQYDNDQIYNFWYEIKQLLQDLNSISKLMISPDFQKISVNSYLVKTYFNLNQLNKSEKILKETQDIFSKFIQKYKEQQITQKQKNRRASSKQILKVNPKSPQILKAKEIENRQVKSLTTPKQITHQKSKDLLNLAKQPFFPSKSQLNDDKVQEKIIVSPKYNSFYLSSDQNLNIHSNMINENLSPTFQNNQNDKDKIQKEEIGHEVIINNSTKNQEKSMFMSFQENKHLQNETKNKSLEQIFENERQKINQQKQILEFRNYQMIQCEQLKLQINFIRAEYFIKIQDYRAAAEILTYILEDNYIIMSHYPYKIIHALKSIFNSCNIYSPELSQMYSKFNKDLYFKIGFIVNNLREDSQNFRNLQLISNLVKDILNKNQDQFGIVLFDIYENKIYQYLDFVKAVQIRPIMGRLIKDILDLFSINNQFNFNQQTFSVDSSQSYYGQDNRYDQKKQISINQYQQNIYFDINQFYTGYSHRYDYQKPFPAMILQISQEEMEGQDLSSENSIYINQENEYINYLNDFIASRIFSKDYKFMKNSQSNQKNKQMVDQQILQLKGDVLGTEELKSQEMLEDWFSDSDFKQKTEQIRQNQFQNVNSILSTQNMLSSPKSDLEVNHQIEKKALKIFNFNEKILNDVKSSDKEGQNQILKIQLEQKNKFQKEIDDQKSQEKIIKNKQKISKNYNAQKEQPVQDKFNTKVLNDRNAAFHLSVRKSILQFFNLSFSFNLKKGSKNKRFSKNQNQLFYQQEYLQTQNQKNYKYKKFLIYCTDFIEIKNNNLFQELCKLLANNKLQIIIFSQQMGNNFLEKYQNKTLNYEDEDIIKIFYSISKLKKYLLSNRDSFCKNTDTTIIEHF